MLKTIDVLIGVSTIMLLASMIVMAITHFLMVIAQARGRHLRTGLTELLLQLAKKQLSDTEARTIIERLLCFPQLKSATGKTGTVVHRDEFIAIVLQLAAGTGPVTLDNVSLQQKLQAVLKEGGIFNPQQTLDSIQNLAEQIARINPELSSSLRHSIAVSQEAAGKFITGVHTWFDRTIDRVSERYTYYTRLVTYGIALLVALTMQIDVIALVNHLSVDDAARAAIINRAIAEQQKYETAMHSAVFAAPDAAAGLRSQPTDSGASPANNPPQPAHETAEKLKQEYLKTRDNVAGYSRDIAAMSGMFAVPSSFAAWREQFRSSMLPGIFLTTILLSLGAPFWYKMLASLIQLRSLAAQKDDQQRAARSASAAPLQASAASEEAQPSSVPEWVRGEQGDLALVG